MLKAQYFTYSFNFKFLAGTSRGSLQNKKSWFLKIWDDSDLRLTGIGEAGPLPKLSIDYDEAQLESTLKEVANNIHKVSLENDPAVSMTELGLDPLKFPSITMAMETALFDLRNGGGRMVYKNLFIEGKKSLPINGLIWMGEKDFMIQQIDNKLEQGFDCIKIKVGALDFHVELEILSYLREKSADVEIRLDANGAFNENNVSSRLEKLAKFNIHSIEQPVKQGNWELMKQVVQDSPIKVALDEELIGIDSSLEKEELLSVLNPDYIILKPSLVGGFASTNSWINLAEKRGIGWWVTSALESNIGLNAICQFTAGYDTNMYQGLGTGSLYHNNIPSPLEVKDQKILYNTQLSWDMSVFS